MNTLPLVLSLVMLTGCTKNVIDTPTGKVACYSRQCLIDNKEHTGWAERDRKIAQLKEDDQREAEERQAWRKAHPEEVKRQQEHATIAFLVWDQQQRARWGCAPEGWCTSYGYLRGW